MNRKLIKEIALVIFVVAIILFVILGIGFMVGFNREYVKYFVKSNANIENEMITGRVKRCK